MDTNKQVCKRAFGSAGARSPDAGGVQAESNFDFDSCLFVFISGCGGFVFVSFVIFRSKFLGCLALNVEC